MTIIKLSAWKPREGFFWFRLSPNHRWIVQEVTIVDEDTVYLNNTMLEYLRTKKPEPDILLNPLEPPKTFL